VRLVDPANPDHWGTGFFIACDVLLTCWHVVHDVAEQRVRVEQPTAGQGAASALACQSLGEAMSLGWTYLGEATLLEAGQGWDLALLSFHPSPAGASGGWARPPVVLPLGEQDPPPGAQLLSSGFPEDAASRHDATYAATGRTTPPGQKVEYLRLKADGVVPGVSGAALVEAETGRVCGVIARNELVGGASDGGLAVPLAVFRTAFPEQGEAVQGRNKLEGQEWGAAAQPRLGRPDWSWPTAWDFRSYREDKRKDFVGRSWLFADVRAWALNPDPRAPQALLIGADYGVGKSAFLAELLATDAAGLPVAAHHFCTSEQEATLTPALFVRNLAVQLAHALPAYRQALEAEEAKEPRQWLDEAERDPSRAFDQAILAPLLKIDPPSAAVLWVVDALDEAQEVRAGGSPGAQLTIVQLLARNASRLPRWIKVLATSRRRPDVLNPLLQAFSLQQLDAEEARNLEDLFTYALERCRRSPLAECLKQAGLSAEEVALFLSAQKQSSGKFLYVVRVLNDLTSGQLPLQSRRDLEQLPPGMDGFYQDAFARRFPNEESYAPVRDILGVLCEQREPLGRKELAAILSGSGQAIAERQVLEWLKPMHDLLRLVSRTEAINGKPHQSVLHGFDHVSLPQWLSESDEWGYGRADRFMVDRAEAAERLRRWALAQVTSQQAHTWPYLVRHLPAHFTEEERPGVMAGVLGEFTWLEARLRQEGINALLGDVSLAAPSPWLGRLDRALRQGAHVLSHSEGWQGHEQLASQLLARLADDGGEAGRFRQRVKDSTVTSGTVTPRFPTLLIDDALVRTLGAGLLYGFESASVLVALPDGNLASGHSDGTIRVWEKSSWDCIATFVLDSFEAVEALRVMPDGHVAIGFEIGSICDLDLANGSYDIIIEEGFCSCMHIDLGSGILFYQTTSHAIQLFNIANAAKITAYSGHTKHICAMVVLGDGRLATASEDDTIRLWSTASGACTIISLNSEKGNGICDLAALHSGHLASVFMDGSIRIWDVSSCECIAEYQRDGLIDDWGSLTVLPDGRLAVAQEKSIRFLDAASGETTRIIEYHDGCHAEKIVALQDGCFASCSNPTIHIWNLSSLSPEQGFRCHKDGVTSLAVLHDGQIASGSYDGSIRIWDPSSGICNAILEDPEDGKECVLSLAFLGDNLLASGSLFSKITIWDLASNSSVIVLNGNGCQVKSLVILKDGGIASSIDGGIRLWDLATGSHIATFKAPKIGVPNLVNLGHCRIASGGNDSTIRIWDLADGSCAVIFRGATGFFSHLAAMSDGRFAYSSSTPYGDNSSLNMFNPYTGQSTVIFSRDGHNYKVESLVALDDDRLVFGLADNTIRLWNPAHPDNAPMVIFVAEATIYSLAWLPSHKLLVAGDFSGRLHWLELPAPSRPITG
jgi:WD40 repeat protein